MKIVGITQARTGSTRLPGKVLMEINNKSLLEIHLERLKQSKLIGRVIVATTTSSNDESICRIAERMGLDFYQGSENDVLDRYYQAAIKFSPDYVVRITSDCPLIDPCLIDDVIQYTIDYGVDYCSNTLIERFPDGQDIEVFKFHALKEAWKNAKLPSEREHVTPYLRKGSSVANYDNEINYGHIRMTVDRKEDFELLKALIELIGENKSWKEYAELIQTNSEIKKLNAHIIRNEYLKKNN